jgi:hypothetical protein
VLPPVPVLVQVLKRSNGFEKFPHPEAALSFPINHIVTFLMWSRRAALFLLLPVVSPVLAGVQEVWYNITYVQDANPDGLFARRVIGINGTWPYVFIS